ncbi:MAG: hypothetical protein ACOC5T_08685 [Elusimicrobiota bacterium]
MVTERRHYAINEAIDDLQNELEGLTINLDGGRADTIFVIGMDVDGGNA